MESEIKKTDWLFLIVCFFLGVIAEESFFRGFEIGISYLVFIFVFYLVFYWRFRCFPYTHQRLGWLILICIWLLGLSYITHRTPFFYVLNILVIPALVMFHLTLVTSPRQLQWHRLMFVGYGFSRIFEAIRYIVGFTGAFRKNVNKEVAQTQLYIFRKVLMGLLISVPVLAVVLTLLMSADLQFKQLIGGFPEWLSVFNAESITRLIIIVFLTAGFFGVLQVLLLKQLKIIEKQASNAVFEVDGIIAITFLAVMDVVYLLFTFVQFKYFFGGTLQGDLTYAEYARKGFFELLCVSVINLSVLTIVITFVKRSSVVLNRLIRLMLTVLVLASGVILFSAFLRLGMYEEAYGFTFTRVLAHSFMIFLGLVFAYTLVKIWIDQLALGHFLFVAVLVYYTAINTVDLDQLVVTKNMERFADSGKIDVSYLNSLPYTGTLGLISLYKKDPNIPNLAAALKQRQEQFIHENDRWQSFNLKKQQAKNELENLKIN